MVAHVIVMTSTTSERLVQCREVNFKSSEGILVPIIINFKRWTLMTKMTIKSNHGLVREDYVVNPPHPWHEAASLAMNVKFFGPGFKCNALLLLLITTTEYLLTSGFVFHAGAVIAKRLIVCILLRRESHKLPKPLRV